MPKTVQSGSGKVIVFDQRDEERKRLQHAKVYDLSRMVKDAGYNVYRYVNALIDPVSASIFSLGPKDADKSVIEIYFPDTDTTSPLFDFNCERHLSELARFINSKTGYRAIAHKVYKDPEDPEKIVGKVLVSIVEKAEPLNK